MSRLLILLPPSEGKAPGGTGSWDPASGAFAALAGARASVAAALAAAVDGPPAGVARLLGVSGRHLERAVAADRAVVGAPVLPAWRRYTGVVWSHLDRATLPAAARRRASASVVVLSALLGAVALDDPVPDYRLKMGARLEPLGPLAAWWRDRLAAPLGARVRDADVLDLLPGEHARALPVDRQEARCWLQVRFERPDRDGAAVGHEAKATKGRFARHVLLAGARTRLVEVVDAFPAEGLVPRYD